MQGYPEKKHIYLERGIIKKNGGGVSFPFGLSLSQMEQPAKKTCVMWGPEDGDGPLPKNDIWKGMSN